MWMLKGTYDPNFTGLIVRRNQTDLRQFIDEAKKVWKNAKFTGKPPIATFGSGAKVYFGNLKDRDSALAWQGVELQRIVIEEAGQIANEDFYLRLISSCRSTNSVKPQVWLTANPGGPGHAFLSKRFGIGVKAPNKSFKDPISGRRRIYVPATIDDNPVLREADPEYVKYLDSLPEPLRSAWRNGDWSVFAGQYFKEFATQVHVKSEEDAKKLGYGNPNNTKFSSVDWGYAAPHCVLWAEVTPKNRVFFYRELYGREKHPMEVGEMIAKISQGERIEMTLGDPSMWIRNALSFRKEETSMYSDASIAHGMMGNSEHPLVPNLVPANNNRVNGWANMAQLMHFTEDTDPNFIIIEGTCKNLIRTIPDMICDEKNPSDIDTTLEDHAVDAARYLLSHVQAPDKMEVKPTRDQEMYDELLNPAPESWTYDWNE